MRCRPGGPSCSTKAVAVPSSARAYVSSVSCDGFGCPTVLGCRRPRVVVCKAPERLKVSWVEDMLPRPFQVCPKVYGRLPDWLARRPGSLLADLEIVEDALQPRDVVCVALTGRSGTGGAAVQDGLPAGELRDEHPLPQHPAGEKNTPARVLAQVDQVAAEDPGPEPQRTVARSGSRDASAGACIRRRPQSASPPRCVWREPPAFR
ncbi:hypothetical protein QF036_002221 [Arthrobacter globiformis]|nr:hypothetical protein [Arthrobacter globiformis]